MLKTLMVVGATLVAGLVTAVPAQAEPAQSKSAQSESAFDGPVLLMAEEDGCFWCARWTEEIGPIYPKTAEGRSVPLHRYDLHSETPDVEFARGVHFTPTFILVENGVELSRIEGYPGQDFFWGLLNVMLQDADIALKEAS